MPNLPTRNNNPGGLKVGGEIGKFSNPAEGKAALYNDLTAKMNGTSTTGLSGNSSLIDFSKTYAPANDGNDPISYAANLANKLGVSPDTKIGELKSRIDDFASAVSSNEGYQQPDSGGYVTRAQLPPAPSSDQTSQSPELGLSGQLNTRLAQGGQALSDAASGKINPLSGILQTVGAGAGAVGDVTGAALNLIPGVKQVSGLIGRGVGALANTGIGKSVVGAGQSFAQAHPEIAGDVGALGNIAMAFPILKGIGLAKNAIGGLLGKAFGKEALSGIIDDVAPQLGTKATARSIAKGGLTKSLIRGEISPTVDTGTKQIAEIVSKYVPGFQNMGTFAEKINATKQAVYGLSDELKQAVATTGSDRLYSFKELGSVLNKVERPLLVASDSTLNNAYDRVIAKALEIAKGEGGRISSLFDARKGLDSFIGQQFPNLYSSDTLTPMRSAVRGIRGAMNDFISQRLPPGNEFKQSLFTQSKLFDAIDNMAPKAVKEIGTTRASRFAGRHPLITGATKKAAMGVGIGLGGGAAVESYNKLFGQ